MKKLLFSAASILLLLGSCSQNELVENVHSKGYNSVTATIEGQNDSRLSIQHNTSTNVFSLAWSDGDSFTVFGDSEGTLYWISGNEFGGTEPANPQYAIYPSTNTRSITNDVVTMTLSATPSVENINLPMWAGAPTNENYAFKHLAAALQFTLNDIPAGYDRLIVKASKPISGEFTATLNDTEPKLASSSTAVEDNKVTVSFTATTNSEKQNKVFYIPLPANTYESLEVSVSDGTNTKELKNWTNLEVVRGKMYYTTATVDAATVDAINAALANAGEKATTVNLTAEIDASAGDVEIPSEAKNVTLNFSETPTTAEATPLTINQNDEATSSAATSELNITMPADAENLYAEINTPTTTTTLNGGSYKIVTATTATNTLIIGEDVTIEKLIVMGGNVVLKGKVESIEATTVATTVILEQDISISKTITIDGDVTIDLNGFNLDASLNTSRPFNMSHGSSLTINGGTSTIKVGAYGLVNIPVGNDANIKLNGGIYQGDTDNGAFIKVRGNDETETNDVNISMTNVQYTDDSDDGWIVNVLDFDGACVVTIDGGEYSAGGGFQGLGNGSSIKNATITNTNSNAPTYFAVEFEGEGPENYVGTIENCTVTSAGYAVTTGFGATATVIDCIVEGATYAYCVFPTGGEINITDGEYNGSLYVYNLDDEPYVDYGRIIIDGVVYTAGSMVDTEEALQNALTSKNNIVFADDISISKTITIDDSVTIDLNGFNLDASLNTSRPFNMSHGSSLTINGGTSTIKVGAYGLVNIPVGNDANIKLNGGIYQGDTDNGAFIKVRGNDETETNAVNISMTNVQYTDASNNGWVLNVLDFDGACVVTIDGGKYSAGGGFQGLSNGSSINNATITNTNSNAPTYFAVEFEGDGSEDYVGTIENCTVTSAGYAVTTGFGATATVIDCIVEGATYAYCVFPTGGKINITGGEYEGDLYIYDLKKPDNDEPYADYGRIIIGGNVEVEKTASTTN